MTLQKKTLTQFLLAAFSIQCGNHFFSLALSAFILITTESVSSAALVMVFGFLPSAFFSNYLGQLIDRKFSKKFLYSVLLYSIIITIICGAIIKLDMGKLGLPILCLSLSVRCLISFMARSLLTKWLKLASEQALQAPRAKLFFLTFFLSTAFSGILASVVLIKMSIILIVMIEIILILVGAGLIKTLPIPRLISASTSATSTPKNSISKNKHYFKTIRHIVTNTKIMRCFLLVIISQSVFQGAYSVLVAALPVKHFNLTISWVGAFQLAASLGIISGFLLCWLYPKFVSYKKSLLFGLLGLIALCILSHSHWLAGSLVLFYLLNFCYESIWLHNSSEYFATIPADEAGSFQFILFSFGSLLMGIFTYLYAIAIDHWGLFSASIIYVCIGLLLFCANYLFGKKLETKPCQTNK